MQQTPIQELIKKLQENKDIFPTAFAGVIKWATELLPTEQQYIQQHAEGFAEWVGNEGWVKHRDFKNQWFKLVFLGETPTATTSELYLVYSMYINSLK